jgi:hypothetical protein
MRARARFGFGLGVASIAVVAAAGCTASNHDRAQSPADGGALAPSPGQAASAAREDSSREAEASAAAQRPEPPVLTVPRAGAPIVPAGHFRVKTWESAVLTRTWLDDEGRGAVPVTEARLLWHAGELYVRVYAGDLDLQVHTRRHDGPVWNDDSVALTFQAFGSADHRRRTIQITPTGVVADGLCPDDATGLDDTRCDLTWESHVRVATDSDGTLNQTGDFDEEWNVEAAIPLAAIAPAGAGAGTRIPLTMSRCEVTANGRRACGSWAGVIVLGES